MSNIVDKIYGIEKLYHVKGCSTSQLEDAQRILGLEFPEEFVDYAKEFGAISFYGTEWTGLNVEGYLNVVEVTKQERERNKLFPLDCFVIENQGIDGIITIVDTKGYVFSAQYDNIVPLCDSLSDYLDICIARKSGGKGREKTS